MFSFFGSKKISEADELNASCHGQVKVPIEEKNEIEVEDDKEDDESDEAIEKLIEEEIKNMDLRVAENIDESKDGTEETNNTTIFSKIDDSIKEKPFPTVSESSNNARVFSFWQLFSLCKKADVVSQPRVEVNQT
jgi:hypothetical protein